MTGAVMDQRKEPTMLFVEREDGRTLVVGLGGSESVLTFVEADGTSFHSVGDMSRTGVLKFWCRGQPDDLLAEMAIPETVGLSAALEFMREGKAPAGVTWEPDW